jgi:hypothetical protein
MPGLVAMQKVGEGYYQTLARAAQQTELARLTFRRLGQAVSLVGTEGALSANALINAFGGLQNYTDRTQAYFEKFYSEAERQAIQAGEFQAAMVSLGLETPRTRAEFRALVDAQAAMGASAYDTYAALLELAGGFDEAVAASEELAQQTAEKLVAAFTGRAGLLPALNLLAAELLYQRFPTASEGDLSRLRARLVSTAPLAEAAQSLGLGDELRLGSGELKTGGFRRESILADALEALIGAVYLDAGLEAARAVVARFCEPLIDTLPPPEDLKDPKTRLQELLQGRGLALPEYRVEQVSGEPHFLESRSRLPLSGRRWP